MKILHVENLSLSGVNLDALREKQDARSDDSKAVAQPDILQRLKTALANPAESHSLSSNGSIVNIDAMRTVQGDFNHWNKEADFWLRISKSEPSAKAAMISASTMLGRNLAHWEKECGFPLRVPFQEVLVLAEDLFGDDEACLAIMDGFTEVIDSPAGSKSFSLSIPRRYIDVRSWARSPYGLWDAAERSESLSRLAIRPASSSDNTSSREEAARKAKDRHELEALVARFRLSLERSMYEYRRSSVRDGKLRSSSRPKTTAAKNLKKSSRKT